MKKRPLLLLVAALIHFAYPLIYLTQFFYISKFPIERFFEIAPYLYNPLISPHFSFISYSAVLVGYGLFKVRLWGLRAFWIMIFYHISYGIYHVSTSGRSEDLVVSILQLSSFGFSLILVGYFLNRDIQAPYFNSRLRWWERPKRYCTFISANCGTILDISTGGVYLKTQDKFELSQQIVLEFEGLKLKSEVVWVNNQGVSQPVGIGLRFLDVDRKQVKLVNALVGRISREQDTGKSQVIPPPAPTRSNKDESKADPKAS